MNTPSTTVRMVLEGLSLAGRRRSASPQSLPALLISDAATQRTLWSPACCDQWAAEVRTDNTHRDVSSQHLEYRKSALLFNALTERTQRLFYALQLTRWTFILSLNWSIIKEPRCFRRTERLLLRPAGHLRTSSCVCFGSFLHGLHLNTTCISSILDHHPPRAQRPLSNEISASRISK